MGELKFLEFHFEYQDLDAEGKPYELFSLVAGETSIGWELDNTAHIMVEMKKAYKNAVDIRAFRREHEREADVKAAMEILEE